MSISEPLVYPFFSASFFRGIAQRAKESGDMEEYEKNIRQSEAIDGMMRRTQEYYKRKDEEELAFTQSIKRLLNRLDNTQELTRRKCKFCAAVTIIVLLVLSAIIFGLEYHGLLYRR